MGTVLSNGSETIIFVRFFKRETSITKYSIFHNQLLRIQAEFREDWILNKLVSGTTVCPVIASIDIQLPVHFNKATLHNVFSSVKINKFLEKYYLNFRIFL
ncbi:hypothetical protein H1C71_038261 [Ictidomys tridecemlineatus]|nr:hypothetical protein H1C71_038261 [Ictidomys tridecemlineatus]